MVFIRKNKGQCGYTIVEIMIVVTILSIIAAIGTSMLMKYLPGMQLRSATRDIYSALTQAKSESIRRGERITVLFDSPNSSYTMFLDSDSNNTVDAGETVLIAPQVLPTRVTFDPDITVVADGDGVSFPNNTAVFTPRGLPVGIGGTIGLCATDSQGNTIRQRSITVSIAGRINTQ